MDPIEFDHVPDIRLIVCDMDGTLLDDDNALHDDFWPVIDQLHQRGVTFCPASGRQYYSLRDRFEPIAHEVIFIAENGAFVVAGHGVELSSDCLDPKAWQEMVLVGRELIATGAHVGVVLCGKRSAYVESPDPEFLARIGWFFHRRAAVEDLLEVADDILKVSLYDFESAERISAPAFARFHGSHQVAVSGAHWLDVMQPGANKGTAVRHVQQSMGITAAQTMVFGDFLNDLEMMDQAHYSFAMANAHPQLAARARFPAPANTDNGVVRTIQSVLRLT